MTPEEVAASYDDAEAEDGAGDDGAGDDGAGDDGYDHEPDFDVHDLDSDDEL